MALQDTNTNYRVMALFAILVAVICCLIAALKVISRASTPWHVSPLAVALALLHLTSDVQFGVLAESTSDTTFWTSIKSVVHFIEPWHGIRKYKGPVAYTLIGLAIYGCFTSSPWSLRRFPSIPG
jgi:hypothetical protein